MQNSGITQKNCVSGRKRLALNLELKMVNGEGRFAGYASVFDVADNQRDIIVRGAFERSLSEKRGSIRLLWQHKQDEPIGVFSHIFEDQRGLYVEGSLILAPPRGKEALALLKSGALNGLSIGFVPVEYHYTTEKNLRMITDLDLFEISLVTFPANENARVTVVKGSQKNLSSFDLKLWRDAQKTGELIRLCDALQYASKQLRS